MAQEVAGFLLVILPSLLICLILLVSAFYIYKIRKVYRYLPISSAFSAINVERCPLCGEKIVREKFTSILFLFPYTFKVLRHHEKRHEDISKYARRTRLAFTLCLLLAIHSFSAAGALRNVEPWVKLEMPLLEIVLGFLVTYFFIQFLVWVFFAYLFLYKKGNIFERKGN